jgi:hypothetical protein
MDSQKRNTLVRKRAAVKASMTHIKKYVSLAESQKPRATHESGNSLTPKIKLPTIEIPKFRGQITEFRHFYDTFSSLIINNQALDDVKKFHYLLSSVTNEA